MVVGRQRAEAEPRRGLGVVGEMFEGIGVAAEVHEGQMGAELHDPLSHRGDPMCFVGKIGRSQQLHASQAGAPARRC